VLWNALLAVWYGDPFVEMLCFLLQSVVVLYTPELSLDLMQTTSVDGCHLNPPLELGLST
jgi:hypothetical protein